MNDHELDAEFERIVAGWDETADEPRRALDQPQRPTEPAIDSPDEPPSAASALPKPGTSLNVPIAPITPHVWRGSPAPDEDVADSADDEDDHFVPPAVHLPSAEDDPMYWATVCCLAGGPLLLLYLLIFDRGGSAWWIVTAVAMTVVGFVMLVLRGGTDRDPFDDGTRV
ncbi:hypothetical protein N864_00425 [Intrasporangium chromatireducens Q5-1]|uniref:Uncharacterized protein n=1 Tax=Intrasporangium chromatireducens Q5-1 TaxID=584657 RepID=W9GMB4_9MICO|nr:hypothetical protein [Intrasporangium chromatireducens]EWT05973.1 hypothetical protein N864_00425 [Intrasporangium chromatireducens Q5-1]